MLDATLLIELAAKSLVVAGGTVVVLRALKNRSAAERSLVGHLGLLALVLLPAASLLIPGWNPLPESEQPVPSAIDWSQIAPTGDGAATTAASVSVASAWTLPSADQLAVWAYLVPLAALLLTMIVAILRLGTMHRRASVLVNPSWQAALAMAQRRMGFKHGTALLVSHDLRSPVSWGVMRPIILLNEEAIGAVDEAEAIIAHELAHVARLDWAKLLISRLACALFWFNPLVWRLARECHQLREEAADDAVLLSDVDGAEYASLLVSAARHDNRALLIAAHGVAPAKDSLRRRITRVLDADLARGPANNRWAALCLVVLVAMAAPLAAFDPTVRDEPAPHATHDGTLAHSTERGTGQIATDRGAREKGVALTATQLAAPDDGRAANAAGSRDRDDEVDAIIASKAVGLTPEYIDAMRAAGFGGSVDDLTGARAVGVTPEFAREMRRYDPGVDLDTVIGAKATGLSAAYFSQMRQMFPRLSLDDAVGMSAVGVTPGFAQQMRGLFPRLSADQLQSMVAVGVTPEFIREMRHQGLPASDPDQAIESRVLFPGAKGAARGRPLAPAARQATATAAARATAVGPDGVAVRNADGSSMAIGRGGVVVRNADGSRTAAAGPPGDDDN
jgi:beta-lactamase regulating signal transducer with metallopeptidase domain